MVYTCGFIDDPTLYSANKIMQINEKNIIDINKLNIIQQTKLVSIDKINEYITQIHKIRNILEILLDLTRKIIYNKINIFNYTSTSNYSDNKKEFIYNGSSFILLYTELLYDIHNNKTCNKIFEELLKQIFLTYYCIIVLAIDNIQQGIKDIIFDNINYKYFNISELSLLLLSYESCLSLTHNLFIILKSHHA